MIAADPTTLRATGADGLRQAAAAVAGAASVAAGVGGGAGRSTPSTGAALGTLGREWSLGLQHTADGLDLLAGLADALAAAFQVAGG